MAHLSNESRDPRIRRTRQLLQQALEKLLETKSFDEVSVQDITGAATVNRATFYGHYPDKFALLECLVGSRFHELLSVRGVEFDNCGSALNAIILAVCDYLTQVQSPDSTRRLEPHMESAIIAVVRGVLLEGLRRHSQEPGTIAPEIIAATASWAIYGATKEWLQTPGRCPPEEMAETVKLLVAPVLQAAKPQARHSLT
jgi:AcrR family transcriptional regulator